MSTPTVTIRRNKNQQTKEKCRKGEKKKVRCEKNRKTIQDGITEKLRRKGIFKSADSWHFRNGADSMDFTAQKHLLQSQSDLPKKVVDELLGILEKAQSAQAQASAALAREHAAQAALARSEMRVKEVEFQNEKLAFELAYLRRMRYGAKSESWPPEQRDLFEETIAADIAAIEVEMGIAGRMQLRRDKSVPVLKTLQQWLTTTRATVAQGGAVMKAIDYCLKRWPALECYAETGICPSTTIASKMPCAQLRLGGKTGYSSDQRRHHLQFIRHSEA